MSELTNELPKPMVPALGKPLILHIIEHYRAFGVQEFIVCAGYKQEMLKRLFIDYVSMKSDTLVDYTNGRISFPMSYRDDWRVLVVDTGLDTQTGGRLKRVAAHVADEPFFLATYADTVSDVDVTATIEFHRKHARLATMTAGFPDARFGAIKLEGDRIVDFDEKPVQQGDFVNRGFFVLSPKVMDYIKDDQTVFESEPLKKLAAEGELMGFRHRGFFHSVDTARDLRDLELILQRHEGSKSRT
jgi:glucose-1-phosphate cytidylyltransferase